MSIPNAQISLGHALEATNMAQRLGHLYAARVSLNAAIKSALTDAVEADAGQEQLPLGDVPAVPGHVHTVAENGVVVTPADEVEASLVTPEDEVTTKRRRIPRRRHPVDDALPTEAQYEREQAEREAEEAAAAAAAEPEWATV